MYAYIASPSVLHYTDHIMITLYRYAPLPCASCILDDILIYVYIHNENVNFCVLSLIHINNINSYK